MIINLDNAEIKVLDHGFVRLVDCMPRVIPCGSENLRCDYSIAEAARVSYGGSLKTEQEDIRLVRYLLRNKHTSPFEMVKFKFHLKLPIFVQRQLIRHRTANVNEISGRYTKISDEFYEPKSIRGQSKSNKQGSSNEPLEITDDLTENYNKYIDTNRKIYELYNVLLEHGVAKELARICLPQNIYTELYWCMDLHNLLHFLDLRKSTHAQYEIREYANAIETLIADVCPVTIDAYKEYFVGSVTFSTKELSLIRAYINNETNVSDTFSSKREENDFYAKMELI